MQDGCFDWLFSNRVWARFEVEDTGAGIREEERERIFAPFVQVGDRTTAEAGTGLGLAISKQYVELMGGTLDVASEPGKGAIFHFEIPAVMLPSETAPAGLRRGRINPAAGQPRHRLLIAEDQPESRLLLRKLMEPLGFELRDTANGQGAVAPFEQWRPHLIWMDIRSIEAIGAHHPPKADALETMARDLQFGRILRMVRAVCSGTDPDT